LRFGKKAIERNTDLQGAPGMKLLAEAFRGKFNVKDLALGAGEAGNGKSHFPNLRINPPC
jgi:hypothetical protein